MIPLEVSKSFPLKILKKTEQPWGPHLCKSHSNDSPNCKIKCLMESSLSNKNPENQIWKNHFLQFRNFLLGRARVKGFQTLSKKFMIYGPKSHHQKFSLQFEVYLLESKLGLRGNTAWIIDIVFPSPSFEPSRFTSNWRLSFWWWILEPQIINYLQRVWNPLTFTRPSKGVP